MSLISLSPTSVPLALGIGVRGHSNGLRVAGSTVRKSVEWVRDVADVCMTGLRTARSYGREGINRFSDDLRARNWDHSLGRVGSTLYSLVVFCGGDPLPLAVRTGITQGADPLTMERARLAAGRGGVPEGYRPTAEETQRVRQWLLDRRLSGADLAYAWLDTREGTPGVGIGKLHCPVSDSYLTLVYMAPRSRFQASTFTSPVPLLVLRGGGGLYAGDGQGASNHLSGEVIDPAKHVTVKAIGTVPIVMILLTDPSHVTLGA